MSRAHPCGGADDVNDLLGAWREIVLARRPVRAAPHPQPGTDASHGLRNERLSGSEALSVPLLSVVVPHEIAKLRVAGRALTGVLR